MHGMGKDRRAAIDAAKQLNSILFPSAVLTEKVLGQNRETFADFLDWFKRETLPGLEVAESTRRDYRQKLLHVRASLGALETSSITVADIAGFLDNYPPTQSNHYRSTLALLFKHAMSRGLCESNPAASTLKRKQKKIQQRLTLEAFTAIHARAPVWLQNAMDLGLLTLQRRGDLAALKWEQVRDGYIWIQQQKVEKWESGNLKIRITPEIQAVLDRCQDGIKSAYVLHRQPDKRRKSEGREDFTAILPGLISKEFLKARNASEFYPADADALTLPGFHEIRSLGASLYEQSGKPKARVQALLGHTSEKMTEHYLKGHAVRWSEVEI
jgi:integrase